ncbi:MAG: KH domain-containing protein [Candidatus Micrarchaeia archaeon]
MQRIYIPEERIKLLKKNNLIKEIEKNNDCRINIIDRNIVEIIAEDAFKEYLLKDVIFAFGRGFKLNIAEKLLYDNEYFFQIDLGNIFSKKTQIQRIKSRIIGRNGKTKMYIEEVSGAELSIYGDTVSFIGKEESIYEAKTAVKAIINGKTHRTAYRYMEAAHRKNKDQNEFSSIMK